MVWDRWDLWDGMMRIMVFCPIGPIRPISPIRFQHDADFTDLALSVPLNPKLDSFMKSDAARITHWSTRERLTYSVPVVRRASTGCAGILHHSFIIP